MVQITIHPQVAGEGQRPGLAGGWACRCDGRGVKTHRQTRHIGSLYHFAYDSELLGLKAYMYRSLSRD